MKEEWKVVKDFENYLVSNSGKVISIQRKKPRNLKYDYTRRYPCVTLCQDSTQRRVFVHILVAECFLDNPKSKPQINHIDGDKFNPSADNLEWCTQSENQLHAYRTGLQGCGEKMYGAKRTDNQIHYVCKLISDGLIRGAILKECTYMSKGVFDGIRGRRRWKHISKHYTW